MRAGVAPARKIRNRNVEEMNILGISTCSHDGSACLVRDGAVIATAREEHFPVNTTRSSLPGQAIASCLKQADIDAQDLDCIAFDGKPLLTLKRMITTCLASVPAGLGSFLAEMPPWLEQKLWMKRRIVRETGFQGRIIFPEHHEILAASAFFPSPFREAAYLIVDGACEWATASYGLGDEEGITVLAEMRFPHSLGLLYSAFTRYSGLKSDSDEDALVEAASSGEPSYKSLILSNLMELKEDGSFRLNMEYFEYRAGLLVAGVRFAELFGRPAKAAGDSLTALDMDLASSIRAVIEEIILKMVEHLHARTGQKNLCCSGWLFRNCVDGDRILRQSSFDDLWVQPEAGGSGAALGAALFARHQYLGNTETVAVTG